MRALFSTGRGCVPDPPAGATRGPLRPATESRVAPRAVLDPTGKARRRSRLAICNRGATQPRRASAPVECSRASVTGCQPHSAPARRAVRALFSTGRGCAPDPRRRYAGTPAARYRVPRRTESGAGPDWRGTTTEQIGHLRPRSNAAQTGFSAGRMQQGFCCGLRAPLRAREARRSRLVQYRTGLLSRTPAGAARLGRPRRPRTSKNKAA